MTNIKNYKKPCIIASSMFSDCQIYNDQFGIEQKLNENKIFFVKLEISPLSHGWNEPLKENYYKSGCAPIEALSRAKTLIEEGEAEAVIISGKDFLRSDYSKQDRKKLMEIYGHENSIPLAYTKLALEFMKINNISKKEFKKISRLLFNNYLKTYSKNQNINYSDKQSMLSQPVTDLFSMGDCANPLIDFSGKLIVTSQQIADKLGVSLNNQIEIMGIGLGIIPNDGLEYISEIAQYTHLKNAYHTAVREAGIDFQSLFINKKAFIEIYTCFPVVPIAFMLVTYMAKDINEITKILFNNEITVTGGMNLAKAPWNNPSLKALIEMYNKLVASKIRYGAVHGNGGLGYKQGFAILCKN